MYLEIQNPTIDLREEATAEVGEDWGDFADEDVIDLSQPENQRLLYSPTQILAQALEQSTITPDDPLEGGAAEGVRAWMSNRYQNVAAQYHQQHPEAEIAPDPYQDPEVFGRMSRRRSGGGRFASSARISIPSRSYNLGYA